MSACERCGAAEGEPHLTGQGQHDVVATIDVRLDLAELLAITVGDGE